MLTLTLPVRTPALFYVVFCSATRACSDSLPCGETFEARQIGTLPLAVRS
jgi:hypothetical protein